MRHVTWILGAMLLASMGVASASAPDWVAEGTVLTHSHEVRDASDTVLGNNVLTYGLGGVRDDRIAVRQSSASGHASDGSFLVDLKNRRIREAPDAAVVGDTYPLWLPDVRAGDPVRIGSTIHDVLPATEIQGRLVVVARWSGSDESGREATSSYVYDAESRRLLAFVHEAGGRTTIQRETGFSVASDAPAGIGGASIAVFLVVAVAALGGVAFVAKRNRERSGVLSRMRFGSVTRTTTEPLQAPEASPHSARTAFCGSCGGALAADDRFCNGCGVPANRAGGG